MAAPVLEVRIDWRNQGFSFVSNDGFETDTSGWSIASGAWNSAAVSLTQTAGGYVGSYCGELTTTLTQYSGCKYDFGTTSFASGRTYRFRLAMKRVSGTTSAIIRVGSAGLSDDAFAAVTLTTSWAVYSVDWTPSATRTDVECAVMTNAAASLVVDLDHVEVYEALQDVTGYVIEAQWTRGLSLVGQASTVGTCALLMRNDDNRFDPANTSGPYGSNVMLAREVWIRSTYNGTVKGHFHGNIQRYAPTPQMRTLVIEGADMFDILDHSDVSVSASMTRTMRDFRVAILDDAGIAASRRSLAAADPECTMGLTEADQDSALDVLEQLNLATGTVHYIEPSASASVLSRYLTRVRPSLMTGSPVETWNASDVTVDAVEYSIEDVVNVMRVTPVQRALDENQLVWTSPHPLFVVEAGKSRTYWATFEDPVFNQTVYYSKTGGTATVTLTAFSRSAKVVVAASGSAVTISDLYIMGKPFKALDQETAEYRDPPSVVSYWVRVPTGRKGQRRIIWRKRMVASTVHAYGRRENEIVSDWIPSEAHAYGLASWWVYRYSEPVIRPSVMVYHDDYGTQVNRELKQRVALTSTRLSLSAKELLITALTTTVRPAGEWVTVYQTEQAPTSQVLFTIGGTADEGIGGSGILAY